MATDRSSAKADGFSAAEKAAMKERARELKVQAKDGEALQAVLDRIAEMPEQDREIVQRLHDVILKAGPDLKARTWYGMPAYARDGKIVVFVQDAGKFDSRYTTLGFNDSANLDDGNMWPASFAIVKVTREVEREVARLVKQALS